MMMTLSIGQAADATYIRRQHQPHRLGLTLKNSIWTSIGN
jgi:hypothetical protein